MATMILEQCKTAKRRKQKLFGFHSFATPGSIVDLIGTFRDNIRVFLQECAQVSDCCVSGFPAWSTLLVCQSTSVTFPLYTIEETAHNSLRPFCDHCKHAGWGHHFVSKRRYHFIIPADVSSENPLKSNSLELRTHLLHGLIHCNGYGHLLSINGIEDNSSYLSREDVMDLWDRICTILRTRKISVNDTLKKGAMEMRLLHGVAYGQSWFAKWGYSFGRGRFGVTETQYTKAMKILMKLDLQKLTESFKNTSHGRKLQKIIHNYRGLSETQLITLSDLLQFMLCFESRTTETIYSRDIHQIKPLKENYRPISYEVFASSMAETDGRWPEERIESVVIAIVDQFKNQGRTVMTRRELRESVRFCIGDTGLIDFVLKSIDSVSIGNRIVRRTVNPSTKLVEFTINGGSFTEAATFLSSAANFDSRWPKKRLELVAKVVWNILRENKENIYGGCSMHRQELRDLARQRVGDTGLIDFVLKSIGGSVVGNQIVCRSRNPLTKLVEYTVEDIAGEDEINNLFQKPDPNIYDDALFLYRHALLGNRDESDSVSLASRVVLNSKVFVKEWEVVNEVDYHLVTITCRVLPSFDELETELTRPLPPGELVVVHPWVTVKELKAVAQRGLRDTCCLMERFVVEQIGGLRGVEDDKVLSYTVEEPGAQVWVRGYGLDLCTKLRYEGGPDNWRVDCVCGAKDDDGEKMVGCDGCHVLMHGWCNNILDDEEGAAENFLCCKCRLEKK